MRATRRYWEAVAIAGFLAALALLLERPLLLVGAAGIGAWLLAQQIRITLALSETLDALDVDQSVSRERLVAEESTSFELSTSLPHPSPLALDVDAGLPVATTGVLQGESTIDIPRGGRRAAVAGTVTWPIAGVHAFDPPTITATTSRGLLCETVQHGPTPSVTVEPRAPRDVHVGEGGERVATTYGEHDAGRLGSGLDPAELREYIPGESADRIDWKATARLAEPYVREFEAETDRRTVLLVDHRARLAVGQTGKTALDYLRQVALAFVASARHRSDPLGLYAVGTEGLTAAIEPSAQTYTTIRGELYAIEPTPDSTALPDDRIGPAAARRTARLLDGEEPFDATLRPYFAGADPYLQRIEGNPLVETVRSQIGSLDGTCWTAIFTDDAEPERVREAVDLARRGDDHVLVFLAPRVLYEPGGLAAVEATYETYLEFESFRRDLAQRPRVSAFEVAPGDRVDAVLAAGRNRHARASGGGA